MAVVIRLCAIHRGPCVAVTSLRTPASGFSMIAERLLLTVTTFYLTMCLRDLSLNTLTLLKDVCMLQMAVTTRALITS